ncbi:hypothetical protein [Arcanobacterium bovis]|uniref:Uncharacterized protein n=1 Tax=Arcanobacterium bovis TaxID=2529275 RepID=A0A4Q9V1B9_9ACTO|nr:hypothetical protein [Arcanobacterium bovis]TBW21567.1 hypothetical protein EZJ44_06440 [Arcanobacterium bovis]
MNAGFRRRTPLHTAGERKNADQIIAAAMKWNLLCLGGIAILLGLSPLAGVSSLSAWSLVCGVLAVAVSNMLSWIFYRHLARHGSRFQGAASALMFVTKLFLLILLVFVAKSLEIIAFREMLCGFAGAIVVSLLVSSVVVMSQPGPPLEIESDGANDSFVTNC